MAKHVTRVSSVPVSTLDAAAAVFGYRLRCMVSRLLSVLLGLLCASSVAIAQSGSVHGSIVDPQNVPVAQAHIRLVNSGEPQLPKQPATRKAISHFLTSPLVCTS